MAILDWLKKTSMLRVCVILCALSAVLFIASVEWYRELSVIPLAWLCSAGMVAVLYAIDRYGFAKVDTIKCMQSSERVHIFYVGMYTLLIALGHFLAYLIIGVV